MVHRQPFDIKKPLVAATAFIFAGEEYKKGDPFPRSAPASSFNLQLIRRQWEAHKVNHAEEAPEADNPVTMKAATRNGSFEINAPWFDKPETVRGKVNAETRLAEVQAAGAPLGWIDGGSDVTVADGDGGWYTVDAPWLETPQRIQGREAAEARQRELHKAGEPETWGGVSLTEGENGYWNVKAAWREDVEKVHGHDLAKQYAGELRAEGPPEIDEDDAEQDDAAEQDEADESAEDEAADDAAAETETAEEQAEPTDGDPHKGKAEKIPGTQPAKAADEVEAAAGGKPSGD